MYVIIYNTIQRRFGVQYETSLKFREISHKYITSKYICLLPLTLDVRKVLEEVPSHFPRINTNSM